MGEYVGVLNKIILINRSIFFCFIMFAYFQLFLVHVIVRRKKIT